MHDLDETTLCNIRVLNLYYFAEDPSSSRMLAIHEHILLEVLLFYAKFAADYVLNEVVQVCFDLIRVQFIGFPDL